MVNFENDEVENLIKLIKLRLLATDCTISLVREAGDNIIIAFLPYYTNVFVLHPRQSASF